MRVCERCGGEIVGRKASAIFCSVACNDRALVERRSAAKWEGVDPERPCAGCGAPMIGKRPHAIYCTRTCKMAASERRRVRSYVSTTERGPSGPRRPALGIGVCQHCSGPSEMRSLKTRYCGERCRNAARYLREGEKRRAYARQYLKDNPERMRAIRRKRKGQIRAAQYVVTERDWRRLVGRYAGLCAYCGSRPWEHRDHVVPLARGGSHGIGNLLPACAPCNLRKKTKFLTEWLYPRPRMEVIPTP